MNVYIVDDDRLMLDAISELVSQVSEIKSCEVESIHFKPENEKKIVKDLKDKVKMEDYLMIDLFLKGKQEVRAAYEDLVSIKIALNVGMPKSQIMFYSNANERGVDRLFALVEECTYLPVSGTAFMKRNKERYERFRCKREEYLEQIEDFLTKEQNEQ